VSYHAPCLRIVSNVTAAFASERLRDPEYWVEHVRATVRFREGLGVLLDEGLGTLLEVGPGPVLAGLARAGAAVHARAATIRTVASLDRRQDDRRALFEALATLAEAGHDIDWSAVDTSFETVRPPRRVALPPIPFDRGVYWVGARRPASRARPLAHAGAREREAVQTSLLGEELHSPGLADRRFERRLSLDALPLLRGHAFRDQVVFPAAGFAAMVLEAARRLHPSAARLVLADLSIDAPLAIDEAQAVALASVVTATGAGARIDIHAGVGAAPAWTHHATATLRAGDEVPIDASDSDADDDDLAPIDVESFYE
jgi:acyl transferase domain-containing protein